MLKFFEVCFGTGAIFTVVSFFLGHVLHFGHTDIGGDLGGTDLGGADLGGADFGGADFAGGELGNIDLGGTELSGFDTMGTDVSVDFDANFHGDMNTHSDAAFSALRPTVILAFITTFGGMGMIFLQKGFSNTIAAMIAVIVAFIIAYSINHFIIVPLNKAQNTSAVSQRKVRGNLGKLSVGITGGSFGRVNYSIGGSIYSSPAKSYDGKDIGKGSQVIIIEIKDKVFYVKKFYYEKISLGLKDE